MYSERSSSVIDHAVLDVAYELLARAERLARRGGEGNIVKCRTYCLGVLILVCSALEAAINVTAGHYYDYGPGADGAKGAGWPEKWFGRRAHSLKHKWTKFAVEIAGTIFSDRMGRDRDWQNDLDRMIRMRHNLVAHFKGRWAAQEVQEDFYAMSISDAEEWFKLARDLIAALRFGYMYTHDAAVINDLPQGGYPKPGLRHPFIEPIETGSAGTTERGFAYFGHPKLPGKGKAKPED